MNPVARLALVLPWCSHTCLLSDVDDMNSVDENVMNDRVCTSSLYNSSRYHRRNGREYAYDDDDDHCDEKEVGYMSRNIVAFDDECGRTRSQSGVNVACRAQKATLETREVLCFSVLWSIAD
jgi:hypothetical protein